MKGRKGYIYRIKLSQNMMLQGYKEYDEVEFATFDKTYHFICEKWGSAILNDSMGLVIQKKKRDGTGEWAFCMTA